MTFQDLKSDYQRQLDDPSFRAENKQRLNLSSRAYTIILNDSVVFRDTSPSKQARNALPSHVINHIFRCFRETAQASAALALHNRRMELENLLASVHPNTAGENAVQLLLDGYQKQLSDGIQRRKEKGIAFSFRLDKNSMEYLASEEGQRERIFYGDRVGSYIKSILEEYAELPYVERERIYYRDILDEIQLAIANKNILKLTMHSVSTGKNGTTNNLLYLKPLGLYQDSERLYNYLVGMKASCKEGPWMPGAIRLTSIKDGKYLKQTAFICKEEKKAIEIAIRKNGVQYLSDSHSSENIKVQFTPEGERMYHRLLHLRPMYTANPEPLIYEFHCTMFQAEAYFFKYGHNVKILEPKSLADKFLRRYQSAANRYQKEE